MKLNIKATDQGKTNHCQVHATVAAACQMINYRHVKRLKQDVPKFIELMKADGVFTDGAGGALPRMVKGMIKHGWEGFRFKGYKYLKGKGIEAGMKEQLDKGRTAIVSIGINTVATGHHKKLLNFPEKDGGTGHTVMFYDYDDEGVFGLNSWGKKWGYYKNGTFKIKWEDVSKLRFMYFLIEDMQVFKDVELNDWFAGDAIWALENDIIRGYDSDIIHDARDRDFKPDQVVTRAEMTAILHRLYKLIKKT